MALRELPLRRVSDRANLVMGGDREMVLSTGVLAGTLAFAAMDWRAFLAGAFMWVVCIRLLRLMAAADPKMRYVYLKHRKYKRYYPARSTPFRQNTRVYK